MDAIAKFCESAPNDPTYTNDMEQALQATRAVRCALVEQGTDQMIDFIIDAGLMKLLFHTLELPQQHNQSTHDETIVELQIETAWCLTNMADNERG
eukprot:scaffold13659_cov76-Amphora_coffeaeformis.AAC.1